jgi:crossover junction endodeoxyribonuclease RuvC
MRVVIGVDPGASGALAISVDGRLEEVVDMPVGPNASGKGERVQPAVLADIVRDWQFRWSPSSALYVAVIERVAAMPSQGVSSMFAFGHSLGAVEGVLSAMGVPVEWVTPSAWKADMGLSTPKIKREPFADEKEAKKAKARAKAQAKDASRAAAARLFPSNAGAFALKKHDGRAEAALMTHWYATRRGGGGE